MIQKSILDLKRGVLLYHVWVYQAYHEISAKYKRTALGSIWISGAMVATSLALAIVMGGIQNQDIRVVLPYVMAGIMCYTLAGTYIMNEAPEVFMSSANIIKNHAYPYMYYVLESFAKTFFIFLHNIVAFYIALLLLGKFVVPHWSLVLGVPAVFTTAVLWGSLTSMLAARYRDMRFMLPFIGQMIFFLTPVFWHAENMTGWREHLVRFNPFYGLVEILRAPLLGEMAPLLAWQQVGVAICLGFVVWSFFFGAFRGKIAFWV